MVQLRSTLAVLALFLTFCTLSLALINYVTYWVGWQQYRSQSFPATTGTVLKVEIVEYSDEEGTRKKIEVHYRYIVDGETYENDQYGFAAWVMPKRDVYRVREDLKRKGTVEVFYDPKDPAQSVIDNRFDVYRALPLGFFPLALNMWCLAGWAWWFSALRTLLTKETIAGFRVHRTSDHVRVRLDPNSPLVAGAVGTGCLSVLALLVLAVVFTKCSKETSLKVGLGCLAFVLAMGLYSFFKIQWDIWRGRHDLTIETSTRLMSLPRLHDGETGVVIPLDRLVGIAVEAGQKPNDSQKYYVTIEFKDEKGETVSKKLRPFTNEYFAKEFAEWIGRLVA